MNQVTPLEPLTCRKKQACKMLSIGPTKLDELIADGRLEVTKVDSLVLIKIASIRKLVGTSV